LLAVGYWQPYFFCLSELESVISVHKPFASLRTPGHWLLGSLGWTIGSGGLWLLLAYALTANLPAAAEWLLELFLFGSTAVLHLLIWLKGVGGGWQAVNERQKHPLLTLVLVVWLAGLLVFQGLCFVLWLLLLGDAAGGGTS
jgi:hypothetical protein